MKISQWTIDCNLGKSQDWSKLPGINGKNVDALNEIGYTGKLGKDKTSFSKYLNGLNNGYSYSVTMTKFDSGDFNEKYSVAVAETNKENLIQPKK